MPFKIGLPCSVRSKGSGKCLTKAVRWMSKVGSEASRCRLGSASASVEVSPLGACRGEGRAVLHTEGTGGWGGKGQEGKFQ